MAKNIMTIENEFEDMKKNVGTLMDNFFLDPFSNKGPLFNNKENMFAIPKADIYEKDNIIIAELDIPGIKKEDIKIEVKDNKLSIKAESKKEKEDKSKGYYRLERRYNGFERSFTIDTEIDEKKIDAKYENGVLKMTIPI